MPHGLGCGCGAPDCDVQHKRVDNLTKCIGCGREVKEQELGGYRAGPYCEDCWKHVVKEE